MGFKGVNITRTCFPDDIAQELKDVSITHLTMFTKGKEILSITEVSLSNIIAKFLLNRLNIHLDQKGLIRESQCGFRKDRGTIDMIFKARQLRKKCQEDNVDLYMTLVELTQS